MNERKRPAPLLAAANDRRRRAFTLLANAYDEARRAISFRRWKYGDAESIVPSLYGTRHRNGRHVHEEAPSRTSDSTSTLRCP